MLWLLARNPSNIGLRLTYNAIVKNISPFSRSSMSGQFRAQSKVFLHWYQNIDSRQERNEERLQVRVTRIHGTYRTQHTYREVTYNYA